MTINISTRLFYDRATSAMQSLTARADTLNTQVSTGKKLLAPSDDSVGYQRLQGVLRANADGTVYGANVGLAQSILQQADTVLGQIGDQLQNASELVIQGQNGTQTDGAREALATSLSGILDSIVSLANTKDARGTPLFGGASGDSAATRNPDGSLSFAAGTGAPIPIGDGQTVLPSSNAASFLAANGSDLGAVLTDIIAALRGGETLTSDQADALSSIGDNVTTAQASIGARAARVDLQAAQLKTAADDREVTRSGIEDVDVTQAITQLQQTMTILSATQASFSKLSQLSLFDYLR